MIGAVRTPWGANTTLDANVLDCGGAILDQAVTSVAPGASEGQR